MKTAANTKMMRVGGRCLRGERLIGQVPHGHWEQQRADVARAASALDAKSTGHATPKCDYCEFLAFAAHQTTSISSVKSDCLSISVSKKFACFSSGEVLPPRGLAAQLPVVR